MSGQTRRAALASARRCHTINTRKAVRSAAALPGPRRGVRGKAPTKVVCVTVGSSSPSPSGVAQKAQKARKAA